MKKFISKVTKKVKLLCLTAAISLVSAVSVFAADTDTAITGDTLSPIIDSLTSQINVSSIVAILAIVIGACVGLVFMWWGVRKVISALMAAFKKGKIRV